MKCKNIALCQQRIECCGLSTHFNDRFGWNHRVVNQDLWLERSQSRDDFPPNSTETDDADGLVFESAHEG